MHLIQSTSLHTLNADKPLTKIQQWLWFILNRLNNAFFPQVVDKNLSIKHFQCDISEKDWLAFAPKSSPARVLSDLFWMKLPWSSIKKELEEIHILDIGCGKGEYSTKFRVFSEGKIDSYVGVDIQPRKEWQCSQKEDVKFFRYF